MVFGPYDFGSIQKAITNPGLAVAESKRLYKMSIERPVYNELKYHVEKNKNSQYAFILHWNQYVKDELGIAQVPFFVDAFIEKFDPIIIGSQKSYEHHKEQLEYIFSYTPGGRAPMIEFDIEQDHTICAQLGDPHSDVTRREEYIIRNDVDYVLTQYYAPFKRHFSRLDEYELIHFPWAMPEEFIVDPDSITPGEAELVVLGDTGGARSPYETREWCSEFPFVKDPHRDVFENKTYSGGEYYEWLRNFEAVVAANSLADDFRYVTSKFFEIPAAGALLFAQYSEDLERLGFTDENCIIFDKENFEDEARAYLESPEKYLSVRREGAKLIGHRHTISDRIETLTDLFHG